MDSVAQVRAAAVRMLARREHTRGEIAMKLKSRGSTPSDIDDALRSLEEEGLLSDERAAELYVRQRAGKGYGELRIRAELQNKGVDNAVIARCLENEAVDWYELARHVVDKKFSGIISGDNKSLMKQQRFLASRGFGGDIIRRVLQT